MTESYQNKDAISDNQNQKLERCLIHGSCNHTFNKLSNYQNLLLIRKRSNCV